MSFLISKSLEDRLDEKTFIGNNNKSYEDEIFLLNQKNLKSITYTNLKRVFITFFCDEYSISKFLNKKIKIIKFHNLSFKKLKIKQIVIEEGQYILKISCKEKKIENIK